MAKLNEMVLISSPEALANYLSNANSMVLFQGQNLTVRMLSNLLTAFNQNAVIKLRARIDNDHLPNEDCNINILVENNELIFQVSSY